jgi:hypothetical protein
VTGSWDFNYGPDGDLYYSTGDDLYRVNQSDGAGTLVGAFGGGLQFGSIVAADGLLYGFGSSVPGAQAMYSIDLDTGAATLVQAVTLDFGNFAAETLAPTGTPEPGSCVLMLLGIGGVFWRLAGAPSAGRFQLGEVMNHSRERGTKPEAKADE